MAKKKYLPTGLSIEEVNERFLTGKSNYKKEENIKSNWQIFSNNFFTFFNMILAILAVLLFLIKSYANMWFIVIAVINTGIGIYQELRAKYTIQKLSLIKERKIVVIRQGVFVEIPIEEIVIDDLVSYTSGKQVVADAVIEDGKLTVNEANITGESDNIIKKPGDFLYSGSFVVSGEGFCKVTAVGKDNYIDTLQCEAKTLNKPKSVILGTLKGILKVIGVIIIPLGIMTFYNVYTSSGYDYLPDFIDNSVLFSEAVKKMAGSMVAMVPSGLFLLTTMTFSVSVIRLAKHDTLIQELYSIETIARVDTLCLDKTGTITDGSMIVDGYDVLKGYSSKTYTKTMIRNIMSSINFALNDKNQTADALKDYFGSSEKLIAKKIVSFNSKNKYSLCQLESETYCLGAPEIIYRGQYKTIKPLVETYAKEGKRVLLLAEVDGILKEKFKGKARAIALIIINDNIRESAISTITEFKESDVNIKVISGDNALTVAEVSRRAGVNNTDKYISMDEVSDDDIERVANEFNVFGRVRPEQKQKLIECMQQHDHKVCMIGDGVNDILALKQADVSVSLASGTDATRNISHIVLLNNDFSSLPRVVKQGRQIVCNMEKASVLYLVKNVYTILLTFILLLTSQIYPFQPIQLFVIETFIVGIPTFFLAIESHDRRITGNFFKNVMKNVLPGVFFVIANLLGVYIFSGAFYNLGAEELSTVGIIAATFAYWLILVNSCYPLNKFRTALVLFAMASAAICFIAFPNFFIITTLSLPAVLLMLLLMETTYIGMSSYHGRFF